MATTSAQRGASRFLVAFTMQLEAAASRRIAASAFALAQHRAQKMSFKQRHGVLKADTWLEEALSFTGGEVVA